MTSPPTPGAPRAARPRRARRALLWGALVALLLVAQTLLVVLTVRHESTRAQEDADGAAVAAAADFRRELLREMQLLQVMALTPGPAQRTREAAAALLQRRQGLERVEWRDAGGRITDAIDTPFSPTLFTHLPRHNVSTEADLACTAARRAAAPMFSRSYFVPLPGGLGTEVLDLCLPVQRGGREAGFLVASFSLARVLEGVLAPRDARRHEFSVVEGDGTRLARAGVPRGAGVYVAERVLDLPGTAFVLRADSASGRPSLIPNLATALVLGLSMALFAVVLMLARDVRRRAQAERALAEALAMRHAMEDSLPTGLRARDLAGAITYANPAFCAMVGFSQDELRMPPEAPPYWPPEHAAEYAQRQRLRQDGNGHTPAEQREGFETVFMRKSGERFPVMVYEAPLVDADGRHTGWMSAVLDVGAQRRVEDLSRQQQERLQATARLATVGEMASLLSHELNQPLAAIASYASGSLNLMQAPDAGTPALLQQALTRIAEQAERAGRVIKSVHDFVRRRQQQHEWLGAQALLDAVLPLVRLQARKSGTRVEVDLPPAAECNARIRGDRTMLEQVLLNLTRNAIQAMEETTDLAARVLTLRVRCTATQGLAFGVIDAGPGIAPDVAARLFTPFFTTRCEGMGLGLSLCRTVIEQHGGVLEFLPGPPLAPDGAARGTEFRFTLPAPKRAEPGETCAAPTSPPTP